MRVKAIDYSKKDYLRRHDWIISITDFENPTVTVTGRRYFLSGTHIIVPDSVRNAHLICQGITAPSAAWTISPIPTLMV